MQKKNFLVFISTFFFLFNSVSLSVFAVSPQATSSSTTEDNTQTVVTDNLKKRLQETIKTAQENLITSSSKPLAFVGSVEDIIQQTIKIHTPQDTIKYATLDENTTIIRSPANRSIKLNDIQLDDKIIAMGYLKTDEENSDTLIAKRIIVSQTLSFQLNKISGMARVKKINRYQLEIEPIDQTSDSPTNLKLNSKTIIKDHDQILSLKDLESDQTIIYIANTSSSKTNPLASIIMIVN